MSACGAAEYGSAGRDSRMSTCETAGYGSAGWGGKSLGMRVGGKRYECGI